MKRTDNGTIIIDNLPERAAYIRKISKLNYSKNKSGLVGEVRLTVDDRHYVDVYVWKEFSSMYECNVKGDDSGSYLAKYQGQPHLLSVNEAVDHIYTTPKFGEIHLVNDRFGGGVFAHELMHFAIDYIEYRKVNKTIDELEEDICCVIQNMTTDFWNWFYETNAGEGKNGIE